MKHLLKKHRMLSVGIFLAAVLSIIYAAILSPAGKSTGSFSDFCTTLFREEMKSNTMNLHFTLKDPKAAGIDSYEITLGSLSGDSPHNQARQLKKLSEELKKYSHRSLGEKERLTCRLLSDYISRQQNLAAYPYYDEPLTPSGGVTSQLPVLLAEYTFRTPADVKDYLSLLTSLPDYFKEIQQFEQEKSRQGLFMSDDSAERTVQQCKEFCEDLNSHYLSETFKDRVQKLTELKVISKKQRDSYIKTHEKILKNCVFPAYKSLAQSLEKLKGSGKNQGGLCHLPEGKKYYAYLIKSSTGDYRSVREIQKHLYQQLFLDFEEIQNLVQKDPDIFTKAAQLPQTASSSPEQMLDYLSRVMTDDFPKLTVKDYEVKYVPDSMEEFSSPAFYLTPPVDTLTPNTIYINQSTTVSDVQRFTTLAHEGFPGHLYQTVYFGKQDCPPIRHLLGCSGYVEGWATYVENMAYEYSCCFLQTDPEVMEFLRLNRSVTLCLYSILDIGIHDTGWNLQTVQELLKSFGITDENACREIFQYIVENPANYLKYYLGFLNFTALKSNVQEIQGTDFNLKLFHQNLLEIGPAPFPIVKKYLLMRY